MRMNVGKLEVRVEIRKKRSGNMNAAERVYKNQQAIEHYDKTKEKVNTDYFFGA